MTNTLLLRIALAITMLAHSVPSIVTGGVNEFGTLYLDKVGFAPFGLFLAWAIKLSHVACAVCLILDRYVKPAAIVTIFILVVGIFMIHFQEGWFVVGFGRNGMEFNFLLIMIFLSLIFPKGFVKSNA
jgi:putative oxidoreductase